ncbi:MAG: hypothetical protein KatS3mg026_1514 [Bacteroidia bacterium]|nr:MAG: hypothetical protein KatS3mg026_1514 [Bacteroidia bacterium]
MEAGQLQALLKLLEDPDPVVQSHIEQVLLEAGSDAIPFLEAQWLQTADPYLQQRIEELLEKIQLETVGQALYEWRKDPKQPLLPALLHMARLRYPSLDTQRYTQAFQRLVHTAWLQTSAYNDLLEKFSSLNQHLFHQERFRPELTRPHQPRYYFINEALDTRRGNLFSLHVLYYLIARELDLAVSLIAIGNRYFIRYYDGSLHFYIDAWRQGAFLLPDQLQDRLREAQLSDNLAHYPPLSPPYIVLRAIEHLIHAYEAEEEAPKKALFEALRERIAISF